MSKEALGIYDLEQVPHIVNSRGAAWRGAACARRCTAKPLLLRPALAGCLCHIACMTFILPMRHLASKMLHTFATLGMCICNLVKHKFA